MSKLISDHRGKVIPFLWLHTPILRLELYINRKQHMGRDQWVGTALAQGRENPGLLGNGHSSVKSPRVTEHSPVSSVDPCLYRGQVLPADDFWFGFVTGVGPQTPDHKDQYFLWWFHLQKNPKMVTSNLIMTLTPLSIAVEEHDFCWVTAARLCIY